MNAVEIEEAISALAEQPFDATEFPFAFLEAFGNKATTIKRLRSGASNKSDVGGVLQTSNIHIAAADPGSVTEKLAALRASPATTRGKAKFILATDGVEFQAEDLNTGEVIVCEYRTWMMLRPSTSNCGSAAYSISSSRLPPPLPCPPRRIA